jgi:hypothetical protein
MNTIKTHPKFREACIKVANDMRELAYRIRKDDEYANHVTTYEKDKSLYDGLKRADEVEAGEINTFKAWQDINFELTGICVPLLK